MADVVSFAALQKVHESLLQKQQQVSESNQQDFIREVKDYIEKAKRGGANISSTRERDQLRANLRYWANYIYSVDKTFPDTELAPSGVESRPFSTIPFLFMLIVVLMLIAGGYLLFNRLNPSMATEAPTITTVPTTGDATEPPATEPPVETEVVTSPEETPTPEASGFNVTLLSPTNGESVTPEIEFRGTFDNLRPGWAIHVLFIKGDKFFPISEYYLIPDQTKSTDWTIPTQLTESAEELSKTQSYSVVLAVSLDEASREILANSTETGIDINSLPSTVLTFQGTSTVLYRKGYVVIDEMRLVYPVYDGNSYDLYVSKPDGTDPRQITSLPDINEKSPNISPDGTKIVYVQVVRATNEYSIHIMDSNGENDRELINGEKNILENPKWSPDAAYISYTLGDTSQSRTYWSIHAYQLVAGNDQIVSGKPAAQILNRYHCWIPNSNQIVFNAGTRNSGTSGFIQVSMDSPEEELLFFDTTEEEFQPDISLMENEYLLTYTVLNPDFSHDVFAVVNPNGETSVNNTPVRLTRTTGGSDFPIFEPGSNIIYFVRIGNIYRLQFKIIDDKVVPQIGSNGTDNEYYGDLVVRTGTTSDNPSFDVGHVQGYFPVP